MQDRKNKRDVVIFLSPCYHHIYVSAGEYVYEKSRPFTKYSDCSLKFFSSFPVRMCTLPNIPFSTYIKKPDNFNRTYTTGERITLACKKGFKELPNGNPVRICINGLWTRFPFKCEGMLCMQLTKLEVPFQFLKWSLSFSNVGF